MDKKEKMNTENRKFSVSQTLGAQKVCDINEDILKSETSLTKEIAEKDADIPPAYDELEDRKKKVLGFLKQKNTWMTYILLAFITFIGVYIRTRNIPKLKDITTGTWTLGPDLDPFLFLRWAKYIVENGSLMVIDTMKYVPIGYNTSEEMKLLSYMIAWFYHFLAFFSKSMSVTLAAIWFPVFLFALTTIAFFLFSRKVFYKENYKTQNIIALIATAFFVLIPSLLPRTIAGIPEKESAAFFFIFMSFYFFLEAITSEKLSKSLIFGVLAGIMTGLLALIWGGFIFVFFTIPPTMLLAFIFGKVKKREFFIYLSWLLTSFIIMMPFSARYTISNIVMSTSTGFGIAVFVIIGMSLLIMNQKKFKEIQSKINLPKEIISIIFSAAVLLIIALIILKPTFFVIQLTNIKNDLISPLDNRFSLTVAENKQPYFVSDWRGNFGPIKFNLPIFFWLFFIGSAALFGHLIKNLKTKEKLILISSYVLFLICLIFSRYSPSSILNGVSGLSLSVYFGGWLIFLASFGYIYYKVYRDQRFSVFEDFNFAYILYFLILTLGIIGARGGIRLIMVLGAISPVAVAFLAVSLTQKYINRKDESIKLFIGIIALVVIIASVFTIWNYYNYDKSVAGNYAPDSYTQQWQKAMARVRENTSANAVFAHWWDYGYWLQSIGERATILDGGNAVGYWNHLLGRYVLTGDDERKSLEFLYSHNGTHLLIDSTDIGKYTAFSSIGSDENYDRFSWISTFLMNEKNTQETNNKTAYVYVGGSAVDEDITWKEDNKTIFLPKKAASVGAVVIEQNKNKETLQPKAIFVYNGNQYMIPLRYAYFDSKLNDFGSGLDAGVFIFPAVAQNSGGLSINRIGAVLYLSKRTVHSQLAELYLFDKKTEHFKLVHTESNSVVNVLKDQGAGIGEFVYYQGFQGPIKIWEIKYPSDIKMNEDYLETEFPDSKLYSVKPGEYN